MKKRILCALAVSLLLTVSCAAQEAGEILSACGAKSAILTEASSGRTITAKNADERLPIASTTKIMTALLVLEHGDLDTPFLVDPDAIRVEGSSMGLCEGDIVTLRSLVWGMLLPSGNDAANAAAVRVAGSIDAFVAQMNERAKALGMENTHFASPSGLETGEHYSTAADMARLAAAAVKNETFVSMTASPSAVVSFGAPPQERRLYNHNRLLSLCDGAIGVKTGFTKAAGRCLVSAVRREDLTLLLVTLSCPDDFNVHTSVYDAAFSSLAYTDFTKQASCVSVPVAGGTGARLPLVPQKPLGAYLTAQEAKRAALSFLIEPFYYAPVKQGDVLGTIELTLDGETVAAVPAVSGERRDAAFPDNRSMIERIKDFFIRPDEKNFPFTIFENEP